MIQKKKFSEAIAANISVVEGLLPIASVSKAGFIKKSMYHELPAPIKRYVYFDLGRQGVFTGIIAFNRNQYRYIALINADLTGTGAFITGFKIKGISGAGGPVVSSAKYYTKENNNYLQFEIKDQQEAYTSVTMLRIGYGQVVEVFTDNSDLSVGATKTIAGNIEEL